MGLILLQSHYEEELMFKLLKEFGSKVILPRSFKPGEMFLRYAGDGIYGVLDVILDDDLSECIYELALPKDYIAYINWELNKLRQSTKSE